jgi:hypothetical protein
MAEKGRSPFFPGQPVPKELFTGRAPQIERLIKRGVGQVAAGKPVAVYIQGEYGIGKSSIAAYVQAVAETSYGLHGIHAFLGAAKELNDVGNAVLEATVRSGALEPSRGEKIRGWLAKYIGKQELFGLSVDLSALKADASRLASPASLLAFLREVRQRLGEDEIKGIVLILDEINGITGNAQFSHFVKGLIDENATSKKPLPLLLILCGVEERRRDMIAHHAPIDRVFDVVEIDVMSEAEMREFFTRAFESAGVSVEKNALESLTEYSAGFPKIMHVIGDSAYWIDNDSVIDEGDVDGALLDAAEEIGKKYVDQQILKAIRSKDYHSTLEKIANLRPLATGFKKAEVTPLLTEDESRKFNNFLMTMKKLNVLKEGVERGEYEFSVRMVRIYLWLASLKKKTPAS